MADDSNVVTGGATKAATVAHLLLDVGDDGTLRDGAEGEDVADGEGGVLAGVDELAGVHALVGDEGLGVDLVAVGVAEDDLGQRRTTAGVVDDLLHDTADVTMALSEVEGAELRRRLVEPFSKVLVCVRRVAIDFWYFRTGVGSEDRATALPLVANDTTLVRLSVIFLLIECPLSFFRVAYHLDALPGSWCSIVACRLSLREVALQRFCAVHLSAKLREERGSGRGETSASTRCMCDSTSHLLASLYRVP